MAITADTPRINSGSKLSCFAEPDEEVLANTIDIWCVLKLVVYRA